MKPSLSFWIVVEVTNPTTTLEEPVSPKQAWPHTFYYHIFYHLKILIHGLPQPSVFKFPHWTAFAANGCHNQPLNDIIILLVEAFKLLMRTVDIILDG